MKKILQKSEKVLHQIAQEVSVSDIKTTKIKKVLKEMSEALKSQADGVAIAAPQIGHSFRIFVVSGKVFDVESLHTGSLSDSAESALPLDSSVCETPRMENSVVKTENLTSVKDMIFINPKISRLSRKKEWMPEGCLSVRPLYGKTFRSTKATIVAYDENGKKFTRGASGILAQIFQHETDHLNGILFIDHAKDIKEEPLK
jgi:peptide deformylase